MKLEDFKNIMTFLDDSPMNSCKLLIKQAQQRFNHIISDDALVSIVLQWYTKKIKNGNHQKYTCSFFYDQYMKRLEKTKSKGHPTIIKDLSSEFELPPTTLARVILAHYISLQNNDENVKFVDEFNRLYKNPFLIKDVNLSAELRRTTADDVSYGPVIASIRNLVGLSYEEKLQRQVEKLNIPYRTEESMRGVGFDKTPDIKLQVPIIVDGKLVNWIESKAMFGSLDSHKQYWLSQYMCYRNRFGPGLVIYWFGFVDKIELDARPAGILIRDDFPSSDSISFHNLPQFSFPKSSKTLEHFKNLNLQQSKAEASKQIVE